MDSKGIASVDLLLATLVAFVIFGSFVSLISTETGNVQTSELAQTRVIGERIASTINTVYTSGNGYTVNMTLPNDNLTYTAQVKTNGTLTMTYNGQSFDILLTPRTNISAVTMTHGQRYKITNNNGTITFTAF